MFSFLSGLYFRGKLNYARAFENPPPRKGPGVHIITPTDGLCSPGLMVTLEDLDRFATGKYVDVLLLIFGKRLLFPKDFVGHGDLARGGMLLQRAASGKELTYIAVSHPSRLGINASKRARTKAKARHEATIGN
ncbi:MAG: hypothetical protein ACRENK_03005 [Gemmatimonadaceae bacterium]